ncbi:hypothetical protein BKA62DRAFT_776483 [Auriculariales sp. MPI-PUGE-AT-0066]|nr:hypothetical protein BKA62DRAFT_776483 [Auriculariales sp. MPI-PUGE-AT-0066]
MQQVDALAGVPVRLPAGMTSDLSIGAVVRPSALDPYNRLKHISQAVSTWSSIFTFAVVTVLGRCLSAADTLANCVWSYNWTVTLWGSVPGAGLVPRAFYVNMLSLMISASLVQTFLRVEALADVWGKPYTSCIIVCATIPQLVIGIFCVSRWKHYNSFMTQLEAALSIRGVISRTIQANVVSLISQIVSFVLFKRDVGMFFLLHDVVVTKVYIFSLLITLNARRSSAAPDRSSTLPHSETDVQSDPDGALEWAGTSKAKRHSNSTSLDTSRRRALGRASIDAMVDSQSCWQHTVDVAADPEKIDLREEAVDGVRVGWISQTPVPRPKREKYERGGSHS